MRFVALITIVFLVSPWRAFGQVTQPAIGLTTDVEDGKKMVHAVVTLTGKPIENVVLQYYVKRTFGNLLLGEDTTLDDGTSAMAFPTDLPGATDGKLHVFVKVKTPDIFAGISSESAFQADVQPLAESQNFPRALWAPHAPLGLMLSIFVLLLGIWLSYFFVVSRIIAIRTGGRQ
jgi:hypothetical protein